MNARQIATEIVLIARQNLTSAAYLRLRRSQLGLPRASRSELLAVIAESERQASVRYTHGEIFEWNLAMISEPEQWIALFARDWTVAA